MAATESRTKLYNLIDLAGFRTKYYCDLRAAAISRNGCVYAGKAVENHREKLLGGAEGKDEFVVDLFSLHRTAREETLSDFRALLRWLAKQAAGILLRVHKALTALIEAVTKMINDRMVVRAREKAKAKLMQKAVSSLVEA